MKTLGLDSKRKQLVERLRKIGEERYHHLHPFNLRMHEGALSRDELRIWVANRYYYQISLPVKDAVILSRLPGQDDRRRWLKRITNQDGLLEHNEDRPNGGIEAWIRLCEACGLSAYRVSSEEMIVPAVRSAVDDYVAFCRRRSWLEAVASSLTELFAPDLMQKRIGVFEKHYPWVSPEGLDYFRRRVGQANEDVDHALELVLSNVSCSQDEEAVCEALIFKCDVLWRMLDAIDGK